MFSNVQNINPTAKPLETEATDTRLRKENHSEDIVDQDQQNQGHTAEESEGEMNIFSINALIYFLEDFLEARLSSKLNESSTPQNVSSIAPWMKVEHSNTNEKLHIPAKNAASAYAHGADTIKGDTERDNAQEKYSHQENVNDAYHLLRDLRDLRDAGITQLRLSDGATFFEGVHNAVHAAKLRLA